MALGPFGFLIAISTNTTIAKVSLPGSPFNAILAQQFQFLLALLTSLFNSPPFSPPVIIIDCFIHIGPC
jgi:hypothetical protein